MKKSKSYNLYINTTTAIFLIVVFLCVHSCVFFYTKEIYLKDFDRFVTKTEIESANYTEKEWSKVDIEYDKFNDELYHRVYKDLAPEDQRSIGKLKVRYKTIKVKAYLKNTFQSVKDGADQFQGAVEELVSGK